MFGLLVSLSIAAAQQDESWRYPDAAPIKKEDLPPLAPIPLGPEPVEAPPPVVRTVRIEPDTGTPAWMLASGAGAAAFVVSIIGLLGLRGILRVEGEGDGAEPEAAEPEAAAQEVREPPAVPPRPG